jgi:hypothetical protein
VLVHLPEQNLVLSHPSRSLVHVCPPWLSA